MSNASIARLTVIRPTMFHRDLRRVGAGWENSSIRHCVTWVGRVGHPASPYPVGMSIEVSESRVVAGDVELAVVQAGAGGEPLLLVHGFTGSKEDFGDEMERLAARGFHVVAPDLRGHGSSDQPGDEADYSLAVFADDMWALADAVGWDRFHLLGHSMGGMIAQVMVLARPDRVHRLVLMDTHHGVVPDLDPDIIALGVHVARTEGLAVIQAVLKMGRDPLTNPAYDRVCRERPGYEEWSDAKMLRCSAVMYASMLAQLASTEDRLDRLSAIGCPALVMVGELDAPFLDASKRIAERIPAATLDVLPLGGHCPQFEATDAWRASFDRFLPGTP